MKLIQFENFQKLLPEKHFLSDIDETYICEEVCSKNIDTNLYKDVTDEEAEEIMKKIENPETEENGENIQSEV